MRPLVRIVGRIQRLAVFEAAARLGSFSAAARELGMTQPAVTRHVRALERSLGVELFHRTSNRSMLSETGRRLADSLELGFGEIERTLAAMHEQHQVFVLGAPPGFAQQLIVPNLDSLQAALPDHDLRLWLYDRDRDLESGSFDVAVRVGDHGWPGHDQVELFPERVVPVATPAFAEEHGLDAEATASQLLGLPLLHMESADRPWMSWTEWFDRFGLPLVPTTRRIVFNNYPTVLSQAFRGNGVALGWRWIVDEELAAGVLVAVGPEIESTRSYRIAWPSRAATEATRQVVAWLEGVVAASRGT